LTTDAEPDIVRSGRPKVSDLRDDPTLPNPIDYKSWKFMIWMGPLFALTFFVLWGYLAGNFPPFPASSSAQQIWQHYHDHRLSILIGTSVAFTFTGLYVVWNVGISRVMERIEGVGGIWSKVEVLGEVMILVAIMLAFIMWLGAAYSVDVIDPATVYALHWMGWMALDLPYIAGTFAIGAVSIVFAKDRRETPLVPRWLCWWGWFTVIVFFPVSAIPFVKSGPLAYNGLISWWVALIPWGVWMFLLSYYLLKAIDRLKAEDAARARI
jgi:hypothetical protein